MLVRSPTSPRSSSYARAIMSAAEEGNGSVKMLPWRGHRRSEPDRVASASCASVQPVPCSGPGSRCDGGRRAIRCVPGLAGIPCDLNRPVIPKLDHSKIFGIGDFQIRKAILLEPLLDEFDLAGNRSASGEDLHSLAVSQPLTNPLHHCLNGLTDLVGVLGVADFLGQGSIEIHTDPGRAAGHDHERG